MTPIMKTRIRLVLVLSVLVPAGFFSKLYTGPGCDFVNNRLGGLFYVSFWILILKLLIPKLQNLLISIFIVILTVSLEFTQLIKTPLLEHIRSSFIGRTLIGNSFAWRDMPMYVFGGFFAWVILYMLDRLKGKP